MDFRKFSQSLNGTALSRRFGHAMGERENVQYLCWVNEEDIKGIRGSWHTLVL